MIALPYPVDNENSEWLVVARGGPDWRISVQFQRNHWKGWVWEPRPVRQAEPIG